MMKVANNNMSRILADDLGIVETAARSAGKTARRDDLGTAMVATQMMRMLAADTGAAELADFRNYPAAVGTHESLLDRVYGMLTDIRADRARRAEMHQRMLRAFTDVRKQTV